jgi:uncharacterized iron-regulated membrane protein
MSSTTTESRPSGRDTTTLDDRPGKLRPILWRLHFLGGFLAAPIVVWLAITGMLYAWNPQIQDLVFGSEMDVVSGGEVRPLSDQVEAAIDEFPDHDVTAVEPAGDAGEPTAVSMQPAGAEPTADFTPVAGAFTAYVDPVDASVTGSITENERPDEWLRNMHSNFRLGTGIGTLTELAASWTIVALLTGLYLWWPRSRGAWRRAVRPDLSGLRGGGRRPWRNLHATTGVVALVLLVGLVVTGLTWTEYSGRWVDVVKDNVGGEAPMLDKELAAGAGASGAEDGGTSGAGDSAGDEGTGTGDEGEAEDHAEHQAAGAGNIDLVALDRVHTGAIDADLATPFTITPAGAPGTAWTVSEVDNSWPIERRSAAVDPASGEVVDELQLGDQPLLDQATTVGIAFHQAELFGLFNQVLLTLLGVALLVLIVAGYMTWWRRRPNGAFGAPPRMSSLLRTVPIPLLIGFVALMVLLPTLGIAFVVFLALERVTRLVRRGPRTEAPVGAGAGPNGG